ncbi:MAG: translocation/assembly module TamB domain-containing protein [Muribaculaceae bacterium]|nr:translocation/assembly module TamB domain-containing protein [Muribaculaceae bacterium]
MKLLRQAIRSFFVTALLLAVVLPAVLFVVLSTPMAQKKVRMLAIERLTELLGTEVAIGYIDYHPFNTLEISDITVADPARPGINALTIGRVSARFELLHFIRTGRLNFDYAVLFAPQVRLWRETEGAPLNIQSIIDRFQPSDPNKPPTRFNLAISTLIIRQGHVSYTVADAPLTQGQFNPRHIDIDRLYLHAYLREATQDGGAVDLEALSFTESAGFRLENLTANVRADSTSLAIENFRVELPGSQLALTPIDIKTDGLKNIGTALRDARLRIATAETATVSTADFSSFVPRLKDLGLTAALDFDLRGTVSRAELYKFSLSVPEGLDLSLTGSVDRVMCPDSVSGEIEIRNLSVRPGIASRLSSFTGQKSAAAVERMLPITLHGRAEGSSKRLWAAINIDGAPGHVVLDGDIISHDRFRTFKATADADVRELHLNTLANRADPGVLTGSVTAEVTANGKAVTDGHVHIDISRAELPGHIFKDIDATASMTPDGITVELQSADPDADMSLSGKGDLQGREKWIAAEWDIRRLRPEVLGKTVLRPGLECSGSGKVDLRGSNFDNINGTLLLTDWMLRAGDESLPLHSLTVDAVADASSYRSITFNSDYLSGTLTGCFTPSSLMPEITGMAATVSPALLDVPESGPASGDNIFTLVLTTDNSEPLCRFLHLPILAVYPAEILAEVNSSEGIAWLTADAPYLVQGDKIIENTLVNATVNSAEGRGLLYLTTLMPTKKGPMTAVVGVTGTSDTFDTHIDWTIDRQIPLNGTIPLSTTLSRNKESGDLCVSTRLRDGQINFGDDVWNISPGAIDWCDRVLRIDNFALKAGAQQIAINGSASETANDSLTVSLDSIHLVSIFETLEIDNALIGGTATGTFTATNALSPLPQLSTSDLHVDSISYNYCTIGNADIKAGWDNEAKAFMLDADIRNFQDQPSHIFGHIFPTTESLDLNFEATHVPVGFMQPFMAAFASDISGYVSGEARLFGTFKDIDMTGDVYADSLRLRIDFTNTYYTASDSIHVRPGVIRLEDITIRDTRGNTASLNGILTHQAFHYPEFDFHVTDARDFLCYDVTEKMNPDWYGTVYGNGGATVSGKPGVINIGVNMTTCPGSTFTFVLNDRLDAEQYSFITFNDATEYSSEEILLSQDDTPELVQEIRRRLSAGDGDAASNYIMDIRADITPQAQINLVMDPVGGDCIRANGTGDLRMYYDAQENDLRMYGTYTLDRGSYNFTLQDIIIKDFTINPGSSIAFRGDPYSATLDLEAVYQVNANLSDLDESFARDKDLNRTNVPVQAVMKVTGDMRQPDLAFDLAFPTLASDTYRKVRSIISTDDMMNRQIIYLLALNRFYTPEYMASTTKGNELFSVAAGTISSQLSSMLGKLSEHWSIAPNLRSDRGDFSDLEVDLALSSRLLNNRLLFNGNFGYRDKSLNTNQFIGDFDLEYLLNPSGIWRLKAYNRYNDQNYYLRSAPTTQGVGIMFRRDFDSLFSRKKSQEKK